VDVVDSAIAVDVEDSRGVVPVVDSVIEVDAVASQEAEDVVVIEEDVVASAVEDEDRIDHMIKMRKRSRRSLALQWLGKKLMFGQLFVWATVCFYSPRFS